MRSVSRCQIGTMKKRGKNIKYLPYAFTRNGINMLATVLRSKIAIQRSILIMRAFSALEQVISVSRRKAIESPEIVKQLSVHSRAIMRLFNENDINKKQMTVFKRLQEEMIALIQKMIVASISMDK